MNNRNSRKNLRPIGKNKPSGGGGQLHLTLTNKNQKIQKQTTSNGTAGTSNYMSQLPGMQAELSSTSRERGFNLGSIVYTTNQSHQNSGNITAVHNPSF
jgi:hypothetical protein